MTIGRRWLVKRKALRHHISFPAAAAGAMVVGLGHDRDETGK
jgi:hypothetical protein